MSKQAWMKSLVVRMIFSRTQGGSMTTWSTIWHDGRDSRWEGEFWGFLVGKFVMGLATSFVFWLVGGLRVLEKYGVVVPERPKKHQFYARKRYPLQWLWKSKSMIMLSSPTKTCGSQHSIRSCGRRSNTIYHTSLGTGTLLEGWDSWMTKYDRRICQMFFCWTCDENCRNKSKVFIP